MPRDRRHRPREAPGSRCGCRRPGLSEKIAGPHAPIGRILHQKSPTRPTSTRLTTSHVGIFNLCCISTTRAVTRRARRSTSAAPDRPGNLLRLALNRTETGLLPAAHTTMSLCGDLSGVRAWWSEGRTRGSCPVRGVVCRRAGGPGWATGWRSRRRSAVGRRGSRRSRDGQGRRPMRRTGRRRGPG